MTKILKALYGDDTARAKKAFESTDPKVLMDLTEDPVLAVRLEIAGNENTPTQGLKILASDKDSGVRMQVAGNINVDKDTIQKLLNDENQAVQEEASYSDHA